VPDGIDPGGGESGPVDADSVGPAATDPGEVDQADTDPGRVARTVSPPIVRCPGATATREPGGRYTSTRDPKRISP
jgi:hypothetical protein